MTLRDRIELRWLRARHEVNRCWVAASYAVRLHSELAKLRSQARAKFGSEGLAIRLPELTHACLARSTCRFFWLASNPCVERQHRQRTARWEACLRKLKSLSPARYRLTEPASQRVYHAALRHCLSDLAGEPVMVPAWDGALPGGLALAIVNWLESVGVGQVPLVLTTPLGSSAIDPLDWNTATPPYAAGLPNSRVGCAATPEVAAARLAAIKEQYAFAQELSLRELRIAYTRSYLAHLALAQAWIATATATAA